MPPGGYLMEPNNAMSPGLAILKVKIPGFEKKLLWKKRLMIKEFMKL